MFEQKKNSHVLKYVRVQFISNRQYLNRDEQCTEWERDETVD